MKYHNCDEIFSIWWKSIINIYIFIKIVQTLQMLLWFAWHELWLNFAMKFIKNVNFSPRWKFTTIIDNLPLKPPWKFVTVIKVNKIDYKSSWWWKFITFDDYTSCSIYYLVEIESTYHSEKLCLTKYGSIWPFWYFPRWWWVGGWVGGFLGEIKIIDHLSPVEAETRAELGKKWQLTGVAGNFLHYCRM